MPFLVLDSVTIPVQAASPVQADVRTFGDAEHSHAGTYLTRTRTRKRAWNVETPWLTSSPAATVRAALVTAPPHAATGDLTGTLTVVAELTAEETATAANGVRLRRYIFRLVEQ